ncbi:MAG TPA: VIT domain-containing protein [Pyrinomonadaceae bacterium]|nr:VIT domain-containing protein [Pyrinomonadaceae bacterium]
MHKLLLTLTLFLFATSTFAQTGETSGSLTALDAEGKAKAMCPLKHTDVKAEISGFISRVVVTQQFENPFKEKIEAVYTFPLSQNAAVDDMTMIIGERTVRGRILPREEARFVYEAAKSSGKVASLLDQQRPNIFTQSVANILPGEQVKITISYVETLSYVNGAYEFVFPMVVGPRYIPANVPDGSRINPKVLPSTTRSGHDISLEVTLDAGLIIDDLSSKTHLVDIQRPDPHSARLRLKENSTIPNKDFILRYDVATQAIQDAVLTHRSDKGGFFTMILQPPERVTVADVTPKELVFVLDTSGSMDGFPIEKAKETMKLALDGLNPSDTFNLITFAGDTSILFPEPVPATTANMRKAQAFLSSRRGYGGTEMMKAIEAALKPSDDQSHVRIVCFMTDGYVGNEMQIIAEVQKHPNARVFAFGIGSAVNRFLLDKMAEAGRGEVEYVGLDDDGSAAARRFHERVRNPLLTDISIDWNGLPVADVYPQRLPDLFSAKPVVVTGRYTGPGRATIRLKGKMAGNDFVREIPVELPETMASHDVLASLWARARIDDLMGQDYQGLQYQTMRQELKDTITQLGIEYRLMTQFTSFVAVEEMVVTDGGQPRRIDVPVESPEGAPAEKFMGAGTGSGTGVRTKRSMTSYGNGNVQANFGYIMSGPVGGQVVTSLDPNQATADAAIRNKALAPAAIDTPPVVNSVTASEPKPATEADLAKAAEERRRELLSHKLHHSIITVVERLRKKETLTTDDEAGFIHNGKAYVQLWLIEKSEANLAKLKELGFEVLLDVKNPRLIIGSISIDKLESLSELAFVSYVSPQVSK